MYITYEAAQYSFNDEWVFTKRSQPPITIPNDLPKTDFMPTKLARVSDMKVVDGSQVNEGYCTLSYSWNQSGEIQQDDNEKYVRIDYGKHKIISYDNIYPEMIIPEYKTRSNSKLDKIYQVLRIIDDYNYYFTKTTKYVKFEVIIRQICRQFNIKYIWYDQLCINQDNKEEKQREIRNMHHIYENAYCTVVLVPEYNNNNVLHIRKQQYFKRLWTLEEAMKSKRLIFVGRNIHLFGREFLFSRSIINLLKPLSQLSTSQILYYAHQRTSTKDHDRVFALIHLFPEFIDKINIDYDQKLEDLMIQFYGLLAKKDISTLFFGKNGFYESAIEKYKFLPSWTGVNGEHFASDIMTSFKNYDIIGKTIHVTTTYVTSNQSIDDDNLTILEQDIPPISLDMNYDIYKEKYRLFILVQLSGTNETKRILLDHFGHYWDSAGKSYFNEISKKLQQLSRFTEIKKENLRWGIESDDYRISRVRFDHLTDSLDDSSAQYVILSEISFKSKLFDQCLWSYPVVKKEKGEEYYKAIGCCSIPSDEDFFSDSNLPKQTFLIQ